jgi:hypothetical protein
MPSKHDVMFSYMAIYSHTGWLVQPRWALKKKLTRYVLLYLWCPLALHCGRVERCKGVTNRIQVMCLKENGMKVDQWSEINVRFYYDIEFIELFKPCELRNTYLHSSNCPPNKSCNSLLHSNASKYSHFLREMSSAPIQSPNHCGMRDESEDRVSRA